MRKQMMLILGIMLVCSGGFLQAMQDLRNRELVRAAKKGNINRIVTLIDQGADVNYRDIYGYTALMKAASNGHLEVLRLLIEKGAQVNLIMRGQSALLAAVGHNQIEAVRLLFEQGALINNHRTADGRSVLTYAALLRHRTICNILVAAMLKLTKEQKDSVYTLIASLERSPTLKTNRDTRRLIAQKLIDAYKQENRSKTRAEIEKIQNDELKNQLLQLLEGR